jgi:nucleotide-binding universal stress UspA family protein
MRRAEGTIVAGVDGSGAATLAVRWAALEAAQRNIGLHLAHAFDPMAGGSYGAGLPVPSTVFDELEHVGERMLGAAAEAAHQVSAGLVVTTQMVMESPVPLLVELSRTARMIVLGSSGRGGFTGMLAGSTAVSVAPHAGCPVVVVRGREGDNGLPTDGPVVVGVDRSPASERALAVAFDEASWRNAPLVAVHSWRDSDYVTASPIDDALTEWASAEVEQQRLVAECLAGWQEKFPDVNVKRVVVKDRPRHQLLLWTARAQLIVVGSRGRGGFRGLLLGSTSQAPIHHAQCSVLIVPPEHVK